MHAQRLYPGDLLDHEARGGRPRRRRGEPSAYVAATRARDVLVVPAIGDADYDGWLATLNPVIYPQP